MCFQKTATGYWMSSGWWPSHHRMTVRLYFHFPETHITACWLKFDTKSQNTMQRSDEPLPKDTIHLLQFSFRSSSKWFNYSCLKIQFMKCDSLLRLNTIVPPFSVLKLSVVVLPLFSLRGLLWRISEPFVSIWRLKGVLKPSLCFSSCIWVTSCCWRPSPWCWCGTLGPAGSTQPSLLFYWLPHRYDRHGYYNHNFH